MRMRIPGLHADRLQESAESGPKGRTSPLILTMGTLVVMLVVTWIRRGSIEFPGPTLVAFTVIAWSPLLVRTYRPLLALAGTVLFESLHLIVVPVVAPASMDAGIRMGAYQPVPIATMVAAFTVAARLPRWLGWSAGVGAGLVLLAVSVLTAPLALLATDMVMFNLVVIATGIGVAVKTRADRLRRERDDQAAATRQAVLDERLRIARELHDVLAHNLTVLNAQASVAEYLLDTDPQAAAAALRGMSAHSAKAIDELRSAVGLLRHDTPADTAGPDPSRSPTPGIDQLPGLVDAVRTAGTPVDLRVTGTPLPLPDLADLAAYRIVQEALTNATKHAGQATVHVTMTWSTTQLELVITNPASPPENMNRPAIAGTGHGLIGMRERADAAGGELTHTHTAAGVFTVRAVLPTSHAPAASTSTRKGLQE